MINIKQDSAITCIRVLNINIYNLKKKLKQQKIDLKTSKGLEKKIIDNNLKSDTRDLKKSQKALKDLERNF